MISLGLLTATHRVMMDSNLDNALYIHESDGTDCQFSRSASNLYYCDMHDNKGTLVMIITVNGQKGVFNAMDVKQADRAREFQETVGLPRTKGLLNIIDNCVIKNILILCHDVQIALDIYGLNTNVLKGKMVWCQPGQVMMEVKVVPCDILSQYSHI